MCAVGILAAYLLYAVLELMLRRRLRSSNDKSADAANNDAGAALTPSRLQRVWVRWKRVDTFVWIGLILLGILICRKR